MKELLLAVALVLASDYIFAFVIVTLMKTKYYMF